MKALNHTIAAGAVALGTVVGTGAAAQDNELLFIGNTASSGAHFALLSYRYALSADDRLRLRVDASYAGYDLTMGTGSITAARAGLSYSVPAGTYATVTLTAGLSHREQDPAGRSGTGAFVIGELSSVMDNGSVALLLAEYDSIAESFYASGTYRFDVGGFTFGPTVNYFDDPDYSRVAAGLSFGFTLSDTFDLETVAAWTEETTTGNPSEEGYYLEVQLRTTF